MRVTPEVVASFGRLPPQGVDVWFFGTDAPLFVGDVLDVGEQARCARFVTPLLQQRFRRVHTATRAILGAYLDCAPRDVDIVIGPHGKPALRDARLQFNLTHKDDVAALAIAHDDIGIDCECINERMDFAAMLPMVAHPAERIDDRATFFRTWARKEAVMKQRGLGFGLAPVGIETFGTPVLDEEWRRTRIDGVAGPFVRDVGAPDRYVAALAAAVPCEVRVLTLERRAREG